jgi:hypothetical protein
MSQVNKYMQVTITNMSAFVVIELYILKLTHWLWILLKLNDVL